METRSTDVLLGPTADSCPQQRICNFLPPLPCFSPPLRVYPCQTFEKTFGVLSRKLHSFEFRWWKPHDRRSVCVELILLRDGQTDRQTDRRTVRSIPVIVIGRAIRRGNNVYSSTRRVFTVQIDERLFNSYHAFSVKQYIHSATLVYQFCPSVRHTQVLCQNCSKYRRNCNWLVSPFIPVLSQN